MNHLQPDMEQVPLFNSLIEISLRVLIVLAELSPPSRDLGELVNFDYLLVHSGDVPGGPSSLHPPVAHRSSGLLVRHRVIRSGLRLLEARDLVVCSLGADGITFSASSVAEAFLGYFTTSHALRARDVARWMRHEFASMSRSDVQAFMNENVGRWGAEMELGVLSEEEFK